MEVTVVLILLVIAAALVAPAFILRKGDPGSSLGSVVGGVQQLAARRGETLRLHVDADGGWKVEGVASLQEGELAGGSLGDEYGGPSFTLLVSAIGTCGFDVRSSNAARFVIIDPLTCKVERP